MVSANGADATTAFIEGCEEIVLSALMSGRELPVSVEDFSEGHRPIFKAIKSQPKNRRNFISVTQVLRESGELDKVGGAGRITEIGSMPHDAEIVQDQLERVLDYSRKRRAAEIGERLQRGEITPDQAEEALAKLNAPHRDLPPIEDAAQLIANPIVLPDEVIEGVLHRGGKAMFGGASKSYKTWICIDLAVSVATGTDWLGKFPTKRGRVLYINLEIQSGFFTKRIQTICDERQLKLEPSYLTVWNLRGYAADISTLLPLLLRGIGRDEYVLIILDPVYKLLGAREENPAGDIASLLNEVERLAVATGAAVAFGAHYSKGNQAGKESIDRVSGSGVFARDPDTLLNFTRHDQADCFTVEATLRNHPPIQPFVVRWDFPLFVVASELDPAELKKTSGAAVKQFRVDQLVDLLTRPMSAAQFRKVALDELDMSRSTFFRLFAEAKTSGTITTNNGKWRRNDH